MKQFAELESIINENNPVKLSDSFSFSMADFKRQAGSYMGFCVLVFVISIVLSFIPLGSFLLSPFLGLGFSIFIYEERVYNNPDFGAFFKSFQKFGNVFLTYLLTIAAYFVAALPLLFLGGIAFIKEGLNAQQNQLSFDPVVTTGLVVGVIITFLLFLVIAICTAFATHFAYFYNLNPSDAIKLSIKMGLKNFWHLMMLFLFSGFVGGIGIILCGIGLLATIPISKLMLYYTFEGLTKLEHNDGPDFDFDSANNPI